MTATKSAAVSWIDAERMACDALGNANLGPRESMAALAAIVPVVRELVDKHEVALLEQYGKGYDDGLKDGDRLAAADLNAMVNRFLAWPLPQDFAPDAGISFTPSKLPHTWPTGTNLLTAAQAKAMLTHCLAALQAIDQEQAA